MRGTWLLAALIEVAACGGPAAANSDVALATDTIHDTVYDTVRVPAHRVAARPSLPDVPSPDVSGGADSSVMDRCVAAGRLQARASDDEMARLHSLEGADEATGPPSDDEEAARDANIISICTSMPGVFLPELRGHDGP